MYQSHDNQQCWTERKNRDQKQRLKKTSDLLYIKLAGRKTAIISITGELE